MAEIDENLQRKKFTALEEAGWLKKRKQIYEALHPETKHGGDRKSQKKSSGQNDHSNAFADDTATKTGKSSRTIRRAVEIGEKLTDAAAAKIADSPIANSRSELKRLADLPPPAQEKAATAIATGKAKTVEEAVYAALRHPFGPQKSDRQIAEHVGVGAPMVSRYRKEMEASDSISQTLQRHPFHHRHPLHLLHRPSSPRRLF